MRKVVVALVLAAVTSGTTGCGDGPRPSVQRRFSIADLKSINPTNKSLVDMKRLPKPPSGYTSEDVELLAVPIANVVAWGLYDSRVHHPSSNQAAFKAVMSSLDRESTTDYRHLVADVIGDHPYEQFLASIFAKDTRVMGRPKMLRANWTAKRETYGYGTVGLAVNLRTITAYDVRSGRSRGVIGVLREMSLLSPDPTKSMWIPGVGTSSNAWGEDFCSLATHGTLKPITNPSGYAREMKTMLKESKRSKVELSDRDKEDENRHYVRELKECPKPR
ncbi:MAG: hypothetical protein ABIR57_12535 [Aeromicrobium sp.]